MPKIKNSYISKKITLEMNLVRTKSLIYEKDQADYLNWFPMVLSLQVEDEIYTFEYLPTISLEGMKYLFSIVDNMIVERRKLSSIKNYRSSVFRWGATEGEFSFVFENIIEEFVSIELWLNIASMKKEYAGYNIGFDFSVISEEFIEFIAQLKNQLYELTEGHEGERLV